MKVQSKLTDYEISVFCRQMSLLLKAGIGPSESVNILMQDVESGSGKNILNALKQVLSSGEQLHVALKLSGMFPEYVVNMVEIGEESGNLDVVMDSLGTYYEREDNIKESIKSALSYPMIMIIMMLVVIIVLIVKVLPIFNQVFAQLGTGMSTFSNSLLKLGNTLSHYSTVLIILLFIIIVFAIAVNKNKKLKERFTSLICKIPAIGKMYESIAAERFANAMVLTLSSGMDTFESLRLANKLVENKTMNKKIDLCINKIAAGESFPEAITGAELFNRFYNKMIEVAFSTGSIDEVMKQIAERYRLETTRRMGNLISVLEPTLVIILSLIVGMILLSVILPLMGIMSNIG
ncbi:MAG: type II secretion system F family protein [Butyrivibrio sp.]|nr:type II secretion system F family protein [Butyrivibrio sp.]